MEKFSDALMAATSPLMAATQERFDRFSEAAEAQPVQFGLPQGVVRVGERALVASMLGTYAEDQTFQWIWSVESPDAPFGLHSHQVRELGERFQIPELVTPLVDLSGFPDPRLAAKRLAFRAAALLGVGAMVTNGYGGRALGFVLIEDPELPSAGPTEPAAEDVPLNLLDLSLPSFLPSGLMRVAAPAIARTFDTGFEMTSGEIGWDTVPTWDPQARTLDFDGLLTTHAEEVGTVRDGVWEWAAPGGEGVARARRVMRDNDAADLADDRVDLSQRPRADHVVEVLARTAAHLGGARGHWAVPGPDGVRHYALTGDDLPQVGEASLHKAVDIAANIVQQLTLIADRYAVMREMVLGLFELHGFVTWHAGEPDLLMGNQGLYQFRVYFSEDGTVNGTAFGLLGDFL